MIRPVNFERNNVDTLTRKMTEREMAKLRESIPEQERCPGCDGKGRVRKEKNIFFFYVVCLICEGAGRATRYKIGDTYKPTGIKKIILCPLCGLESEKDRPDFEKRTIDYLCGNGHGWLLDIAKMTVEEARVSESRSALGLR